MAGRAARPWGALLLLLAAACDGAPRSPAIGFTYNFGDTLFQSFLEEEVERARPDGAIPIRVTGISEGGWRSLGSSALSAEVQRATNLTADRDVIVVVGPGGSREALQVTPIYREARMPNILPSVTSRLLANAGAYSFLLAPNDSLQGEFIGAFADTALHARRAAVIYVPDEYGSGLTAGTAAAFAARGVTLLDRVPMRPNLDCTTAQAIAAYDDLARQLSRHGRPDVIVLATRTITSACSARALRAQFPGAAIIAGDGTYLEPLFTARAGASADGMFLVAFWHESLDRPGNAEFTARFEQRMHRRPRHSEAGFYDGVMLAASAIWTAGADREAVRRHLAALGGTVPAYEGIAGPIAFAGGPRAAMFITRLKGGTSEVVAR